MRSDTTHDGLNGPILGRRREGLIDGLKLAIDGEEILLALSARVEDYKEKFRKLREAAGTQWSQDAGILAVENRIRTLQMIHDHIWEGHTYLLGREDLEFAELLPQPLTPTDTARALEFIKPITSA